jgi:TonB family protein
MRLSFRILALVAVLGLCTSPNIFAKQYSFAELMKMFTYHPWPQYAPELRHRGLSGSGLFRLYVDKGGKVTHVGILKSMGHRELDEQGLKAFVLWRAKPGAQKEVDVPLVFKLERL